MKRQEDVSCGNDVQDMQILFLLTHSGIFSNDPISNIQYPVYWSGFNYIAKANFRRSQIMPLPSKENQPYRLPMREYVFRKLLNWIMDGTLQPGEKIVDKELAEHMGVSRTPVREALHRLEDKGFVETAANRWTRVSEIPSTEPEMIYPIIWSLETLAISISINSLTEEDLTGMEKANTELEMALESKDPEAAFKADKEFHSIFVERSQNFHLINMLEDLKVRYRRLEIKYFQGLSIAKSSIDEHKKLISAFRTGDPTLANTIIILNWRGSLDRYAVLKETAEKSDIIQKKHKSSKENYNE